MQPEKHANGCVWGRSKLRKDYCWLEKQGAAVTEEHLLMRGGDELGTNRQHCSKKVKKATIPPRHTVPFSPVLGASVRDHTRTATGQGENKVHIWASDCTGPHMGSFPLARVTRSPPAAALAVAALLLNPLPLAKHFLSRAYESPIFSHTLVLFLLSLCIRRLQRIPI